jgi:hypothetical protein
MKFITLIPTRRNDGTEVSDSELAKIKARFWVAFGGCSIEGTVEGHWLEDGKHYIDDSIRISVACDNDRLTEAEELVREIDAQLGQLAMYFEVQYFDGVRILKI